MSLLFGNRHSTNLQRDEQQVLLEFARQTIAARLCGKTPPRMKCQSSALKKNQGVFVTLKIGQSLRGCIGMVNGVKPLYQTVQEAAEAAAFNDPRFDPLQGTELPKTKIEISVISSPKKITSVKKIKVRRDGLMVRAGEAQGLLLPQVAERNHWTRKTFLEHACVKAGLSKDEWKKPGTEILTFRAQVFAE